jgi:hypothetical protein
MDGTVWYALPMTTPPPPGWHRDPEGNDYLRWWDGQRWTSATSQPSRPTSPATAGAVTHNAAEEIISPSPDGASNSPTNGTVVAEDRAASRQPWHVNRKTLIAVLSAVAVVAVVVGTVGTKDDGRSEAVSPSPTPTVAAGSPEQIDAAEAACVDALGVRFSTAIQPVGIAGYATTVDGDTYRTVGTSDLFYGSSGAPERYSIVCTGTRSDGRITSEVTTAIQIESPYATTTSSPPPPSSAAPTNPPAAQRPLPSSCNAPSPSVIASIDAAFLEADQHLEDAFLVYGQRDVAYIGANIMDSAGTRLSSSDVWAQSDGVIYSLSGDARRRTSFPDGRRALDISAGDEFGVAVSDCVQISVINRNANGGN